jgi:membrane-associated protein
MEFLHAILDFFLHLDDHLHTMILEYGIWIYVILFLIIFVETGLVVMPFLPGDSLLFAAGTFCAGVVNDQGEAANLNLFLVLGLLIIAAIAGDGLNYFLGKKVGLRMLQMKIGGRQLVKQKFIDQTHVFYEKHGPKTIIIARFVPIVRTFAPFVAGIGDMKYSKFIQYNIIGGVIWVLGLTLLGYFFGTLPFVQKNFELVIFGIIGLSVLPIIFEFIKAKMKSKKKDDKTGSDR